jgi:hypothetical protein
MHDVNTQESEFVVVIREWLEFRRQIERESSTLRITMGQDGESLASSLSQSTELRLLAAVGRYAESDGDGGDSDNVDDDDDTVVIEQEPNYKQEAEAEAEAEEGEDLARSVTMRGERNAAKRRSTKGPLGARILEDYGTFLVLCGGAGSPHEAAHAVCALPARRGRRGQRISDRARAGAADRQRELLPSEGAYSKAAASPA